MSFFCRYKKYIQIYQSHYLFKYLYVLYLRVVSIYNAAGALSGELGSLLTSSLSVTENNFDNLSLLITICGLSSLLTIPFMGLLEVQSDTLSRDSEKNKSSTTPQILSSNKFFFFEIFILCKKRLLFFKIRKGKIKVCID